MSGINGGEKHVRYFLLSRDSSVREVREEGPEETDGHSGLKGVHEKGLVCVVALPKIVNLEWWEKE